MLSFLILFPASLGSSNKASATTGTANPSTTSIILSTVNSSAKVDLSVINPNGTFASSTVDNTASFTVTTNNYTGYTLSITSNDDNGLLENTTTTGVNNNTPISTTYTISSISTNTTKNDFSANTTTSATNYNNKWGILPSTYVSNNTTIDNTGSNPVYLPSPTTTPTILSKTTQANSVDNNANDVDTYTLGLGVRADFTTISGTYKKTITLIALANPIAYTITYNKNTDDAVSNLPASTVGDTSATTITLPNTTPARSGYTFRGWCSVISATGECDGTTYNPNGNGTNLTYGIDQTAGNSATLYAIWRPTRLMQDVFTWSSSLSLNESVQATDSRDGKVYWVTKLETDPNNPRAEIDSTTGKAYQIWMTQNLDLDLSSSTTLTHANTDLGWSTNNNSAAWTPSASTYTDVSSWVGTNTGIESYNPGRAYYYTSGSYEANDATNIDIAYASFNACVNDNHSVIDCEHSFAGNYYNWNAAVATNDSSAFTTTYTQMSDSICPAGWRLPTGLTAADSYSDFGYLLEQNNVLPTGSYGTSNQNTGYKDAGTSSSGLIGFRTSPLWFVRPGDIYSGNNRYPGITGYYWSNTVYVSTNAFSLGAISTGIYPANRYNRLLGYSVRCVARPAKSMQNVATWQDELAINETVQAADIRDNNVYFVTKLETDSNNPRAEYDSTANKYYQIWMTQNLDLNLSTAKTLTHSDTDLGWSNNNTSATWTPSSSTLATSALSSWQNSNANPYSYDPGSTYYYTSGSATADSSNVDTQYTSIDACVEAGHSATDCKHSAAGNYYNWNAAVATNDSSSITTQYAQMPDSICPAGWRLPTGLTAADGYSDFGYLLNQNGVIPADKYGTQSQNTGYKDAGTTASGLLAVRATPLWFARSGYLYVGSTYSRGFNANYWSSSVSSGTSVYTLALHSINIYPALADARSYGFSVRCIAR